MTHTALLKRFNELAGKATPGPWVETSAGGWDAVKPVSDNLAICQLVENRPSNCSFIAALPDLLTLANAQAAVIESNDADIAELVACLRFYAMEWQGNADGDPSTQGLSRSWEEPTDKLFYDAGHNARALLERIGHE